MNHRQNTSELHACFTKLLELQATVPQPCLTPDEAEAIRAAQAEFDIFKTKAHEHSSRQRPERADELASQISRCTGATAVKNPQQLTELITELESFGSPRAAATSAKIEASLAIAAAKSLGTASNIVRAAYERAGTEIDAFYALVHPVAVGLAQAGLEPTRFIEKLKALRKQLSDEAEFARTQNMDGSRNWRWTVGPVALVGVSLKWPKQNTEESGKS